MKRIQVLDLCRSLCVAVMVVWHGLYDMALFGSIEASVMESFLSRAVAFFAAAMFIFMSGICSRFSRYNKKRGFVIFCIGGALSAVMALIGMPVAFGILQFFGVSIMLYGLFGQKLNKVESPVFPAACLLLFALSYCLTESVTVDFRWLYPIGFKYEGFYSADYFPMLPWLFLYLCGTWAGGWVLKNRERPVFKLSFHPALTFLGRRSLVIYLVHQPLLYGLCLIFRQS